MWALKRPGTGPTRAPTEEIRPHLKSPHQCPCATQDPDLRSLQGTTHSPESRASSVLAGSLCSCIPAGREAVSHSSGALISSP